MEEVEIKAPELRVRLWTGPDGSRLKNPLRLSDLGSRTRILFAFQDWCSGCHVHGFPTLQKLHATLGAREVGFAAIQTVFEGWSENTFEKLRSNQTRYGLPIMFGHDVPPDGQQLPTFMEDYQSQGTPWFTIIAPDGHILYSGFRVNAEKVIEYVLLNAGLEGRRQGNPQL